MRKLWEGPEFDQKKTGGASNRMHGGHGDLLKKKRLKMVSGVVCRRISTVWDKVNVRCGLSNSPFWSEVKDRRVKPDFLALIYSDDDPLRKDAVWRFQFMN